MSVEDTVQGEGTPKATIENLTPAQPQSVQAADDKWNEVMGDDGESFADLLGVPKERQDTAETATEPTEELSVTEDPASANEPVATADSQTPDIDASLVSLAVELGADQADLDSLIKSDPDAATELLTKIQDEYNSQSLSLLHGQVSTETPPTSAGHATEDSDDVSGSPLEALLTEGEARDAAIDQYGEEFVEKVLTPLAKRDAQISKREAKLDALFDRMEASQQQAELAEVEAAFTGFGPGYKDFYGAGDARLTDEQFDHRKQVGIIADQLRAGDRVKGNAIQGATHYITRAHHIVSADQRKAAVRMELISQIKTRAKGLIAKPSRGTVDRIDTAEKSEANAMQALDRKISNLGLDAFFDQD